MTNLRTDLDFGCSAAAFAGAHGATPEDRFLPGLRTAVDAAAMASRLQPAMFGAAQGDRIEDCRVERVKYHPGERGAVGYRLSVREDATGHPSEHYLAARLYESGAARERFEKYRRQPLAAPRFGPPLLLLEDLDMILWSFPNDRHLPGLRLLADEQRVGRTIAPGLVAKWWSGDWSIIGFSSSVASYVHERRCSIRAVIGLRSLASGETRDWTVYGKTAGLDSDGALERAARQLWDCPARRSGAFAMPRPLGHWPDRCLAWQEQVAGRPLACGAGAAADDAAFFAAGAAVAALQASPISGLRSTDGADALERARRRAEAIRRGWPARGAAIAPIMDRLEAAAPRPDQTMRATAHGDLHARNLLIEGARVAVIDLDEAVAGPPLQDIGHFIAYTLWEEQAAGREPVVIAAAIRAFVEGYRRHAPWAAPSREIGWWAAAALVSEKVFRGVTLMQPADTRRIAWALVLADAFCRGDMAAAGLDTGGAA